jgi:hypothetical protein
MEQKKLEPIDEKVMGTEQSNWRNWKDGETHDFGLALQESIPGGKVYSKDKDARPKPAVHYEFDYWDGEYGSFQHESQNKGFMHDINEIVKSGKALSSIIRAKRTGTGSATRYMVMVIGDKPKV